MIPRNFFIFSNFEIKAMFTLKCYSEEGVEDIKRALNAGQETGKPENRLKINLISSPLFAINAVSFDPNEGLKVVQTALDKVKFFNILVQFFVNKSFFELI